MFIYSFLKLLFIFINELKMFWKIVFQFSDFLNIFFIDLKKFLKRG